MHVCQSSILLCIKSSSKHMLLLVYPITIQPALKKRKTGARALIFGLLRPQEISGHVTSYKLWLPGSLVQVLALAFNSRLQNAQNPEALNMFLALLEVLHQAPWELPVLLIIIIVTQEGPVEPNTESPGKQVKRTVIDSEAVDPRRTLVNWLLVAQVALGMLRTCLAAGGITVPKILLEEPQLIGYVYQILVHSLPYTKMSVGRSTPVEGRASQVSPDIP